MAEMVKCKLNGRHEIILPKHRAERPEWYTETGWEKKRLNHMWSCIRDFVVDAKKTPVVYYVGVEEGDMTALCALWGAKLVMFEPNELVMPNIKAIWEANKLNMSDTFYPCFASDITDNMIEPVTVADITGEVIHNHGFKELKDPHGITQIKIDDIVEKTGVIPTVISLDVEGSEGRVLRGAEKTLREHRPAIYLSLHPEFLREQYNEWGAELRAWLIALGYKETLIDYPLHEVHLYYE